MRSLDRTIAWRRGMGESHRESARRLRPASTRATCPACDGAEHARFVEIYGFSYHECQACGHLFLANPPAPEDIARLYQGATEQSRVYVGEELFRLRVEQIARPKANFCTEYLAPGGIWFDVGCGTGELMSVVRELGWEPRGCEADRAHVEFARAQGSQVIHGYVDELPSELGDSVRVLSALNLLEHLPEPRAWLERLTRPLAAGAHVVIEVPRHPSLSSFSNLLYPELACRHIYPPDHMHIFTEASLERVLAASGLHARAVWVFGQDYQELMYSSAAHAGLNESAFFHGVLDAGLAIQKAIDAENLCDVLLVVAEKRSPRKEGGA
jgi:2-polyprenyl-3-methyl-5-hydroxy-6-metoxy-1,4-benzoquinol methylase/Zn ribbon nucleic-acid-binding protein